jgi:hypothetical protein
VGAVFWIWPCLGALLARPGWVLGLWGLGLAWLGSPPGAWFRPLGAVALAGVAWRWAVVVVVELGSPGQVRWKDL